jgi:uncharacterized protein involved in exopolysaccharide biosynthesis
VRSWIHLVARLYPARWRQRYGAEFDALLEESTPTWRNTVDVGWGALEMHMKMRSFLKLAAVCGLAGAILAAAIAVRTPDKFISEAVLRVSGDEQSLQFFRDRALQQALSRNSLGELIRENDLYATDRQRRPLEDVIERMRHDIAISFANSATTDPINVAFVVRFVYRDPSRAQRTTGELVSKMVEANLAELLERIRVNSKAEHVNNLEVLSPASLPQKPARPNRLLITALGVSAGLTLAVLATVATRLRRPA